MLSLSQAYAACLAGNDDVAKVTQILVDHGWTSKLGEKQGRITFTPGTGKAVFAYMASDGSLCHVESATVSTVTALALLRKTLDKASFKKVQTDRNDMGCETLQFDSGRRASVMSGSNDLSSEHDQTCTAATNSAVRFRPADFDN